MNDSEKIELIKEHKRIKITSINVLRRLNLSYNDCCDEDNIRRFCHSNNRTLPGMIEIEVTPYTENDKENYETYEWCITIFEQPNLKEKA